MPTNLLTRLLIGGLVGWLTLLNTAWAQEPVRGRVVDAKSSEPVPFATVIVPGTQIGTNTDASGAFTLELPAGIDTLRLQVSQLGYQTLSKPWRGEPELVFRLVPDTKRLNEVYVRAKRQRYRNKDNPAVTLIRRVINEKDKNRRSGLSTYQYEKYEKIRLDVSNVNEKFRQGRAFKNFQFIFDYLDSSNVLGMVSLPLYLKESLSDVYFRQTPKAYKEYLKAEKKVGLERYFDSNGIGAYLNRLYEEIDIYADNISLLANQFTSPISPLAPTLYRFVLGDTVVYDSVRCVKLGFAPRNRADMAFEGTMWIELDSSYAVRKVSMGVPKGINLNLVTAVQIDQEFSQVANSRLMLTRDEVAINFSLVKDEDRIGVLGTRTATYRNYQIDEPIDDKLFKPAQRVVILPEATLHNDSFWQERRHTVLSKSERGVYTMTDSIQQVPLFKRAARIATALLFGYVDMNKFEIGPVNSFYSFNPVEGFRLRAGGRSMARLNPHLYAEGYGAYGFRDRQWKYFGALTYSLNGRSIYDFPNNFVRVSYQYDTRIPGQELQFIQEDNVLLSIKRGSNDRWTYNNVFRVDYRQEYASGFSYDLGFRTLRQTAAGSLRFASYAHPDLPGSIASTEFSVSLRYAPNEKFFQGKNYRIPIVNQYPIMQLRYTAGVSGLFGGQYDFQSLTGRFNKRFYVSPVGFTDFTAEGGRLFGTVPYPLLIIHRANQSYSYQLESYNLMNYLEFVSDRYAAAFVDHYFNGFIFNKLPLIKKLKFREVITMKALWGGLGKNNRPSSADANDIQFLRTADGRPATYALGNKPYMEVSVGVSNIFKIFRLDLVRRLTYLDQPNVSAYGIRGRFKFDF
ncbi:DUF5686 and carboxypeptidase-like regulatory domain-containing protein [Spirosoma utsteinense]|uniref:Carboxypeptidase-like regulatory domain-containing protein n=1 Tax=Spirosoma utsteinense TaxID=2585773 RepID=A0ABR6W5M1_9BACT|nr:DUF5686 and carboxypeptidase-like regulatory domain-containing protein [Spirosoma utsteinense]MBC3791859.1 hypothetical protein [Spirosoma utsteinense]